MPNLMSSSPTVTPVAGLQPPVPAPSAVPLVRWLKDLGRSAVDVAGGKGANLGEMMRAGLPVPDGFVVTPTARAFS